MTHVCIHSAPRTASRAVQKYFEGIASVQRSHHVHYLLDTNISHFKWRKYKHVVDHPQWKVVTIVRDPIERNISDFWNFVWMGHQTDGSIRARASREQFKELFLTSIDHHVGINFIAKEVEPYWDVMVYDDVKFPANGWKVIDQNLLIIRFDKLKGIMTAAGALLNHRVHNKYDSMPYVGKGGYHELIKDMKLPMSYVDMMVDNYHTRYFFTTEERQQMRVKWLVGDAGNE